MSEQNQKRDQGPDVVKAIAILLVVLGHTLRGLVTANIMPAGGFWGTVDHTIYLFHMPVFFFLSGLFLERVFQRLGLIQFIARNANNLLGPLVIWSYLQFGLQYLFPNGANSHLSLYDVATAPYPPRQQFWFLWTLFWITLAAGIFLSLKQGKKGLGFFAALLVCLAVASDFMGLGFISYHSFKLPPFSDAFLYFPYLALGLLLPSKFLTERKISSLLCLGLFVGAIGIYNLEHTPTNLVFYATSFICVLSTYKLGLNLSAFMDARHSRFFMSRLHSLLVFVGINSMIIYLAHIIFQAGIRSAFLKLGIVDPGVHILAGVGAGLLGPLALVPFGKALTAYSPVLGKYLLPVRVPDRGTRSVPATQTVTSVN